jgi:hypothetical protein
MCFAADTQMQMKHPHAILELDMWGREWTGEMRLGVYASAFLHVFHFLGNIVRPTFDQTV